MNPLTPLKMPTSMPFGKPFPTVPVENNYLVRDPKKQNLFFLLKPVFILIRLLCLYVAGEGAGSQVLTRVHRSCESLVIVVAQEHVATLQTGCQI